LVGEFNLKTQVRNVFKNSFTKWVEWCRNCRKNAFRSWYKRRKSCVNNRSSYGSLQPIDKTVNLSNAVYNERNSAAAAVAAHECGHAVQHAQAYSWLELRSTLVPVVNISSKLSMWLIFGGLILGVGAGVGLGYWVVVSGFVLMAVATVFSFITLPVEYDASNRALAWLKNKHMLSQQEYKGAEDALKWAARTYLVAALGSLATLVYWGFQIFGRD